MKKIFVVVLSFFITEVSIAQEKPADTVVVELAKTSRVVFTMRDKSDLTLLKQYDFQALFQDILNRLEKTDTTTQTEVSEPVTQNNTEAAEEDWGDDDNDDEWTTIKRNHYRYRGNRHSFNFDLGTNNFLEEDKFPDNDNAPYAVRPWGSWYVAINSVQRSQLANKFFLEWGIGLSWYNFKFQNDNVRMSKDDNGVQFTLDDASGFNYRKSKLTMSFVNVSLIPMLDFGGYSRKARIWDSHGSNFRIGVGPYAGYRIGSHSKVAYKDDGNREKDKDRNNFYLNNFRYGVRLQLGIRSTDLFFNYDLNELFSDNKAANPKLNAFSFGVIF